MASSSVIVRVWLDGADTPRPPEAVADTVTDLSGASTVLFTALIFTVRVLVVAPAAIVSVSFALSVKSAASAGDTAAADTTSVTFSLDGPLSVAVTVVESPFSPIEAGFNTRVTVGVASSSVIVKVWLDGADTPLPPVTVADTVADLSGASTALFTALILTVRVLVVAPAAIVSVSFALSVKSEATAGDTAVADTTSVTFSLDGPLSVAVTVVESPPSEIDDELSTRVTVGVASSSVIVRVWLDGAATPLPPEAVADTVTDLSGASTALFTALTFTVPVLVVAPAAIVSVSFALSVKSEATAGETAAADTTSVTFSLDTPLSVAVTVVESPFSEIDDGLSTRVTVGVASSSLIVRVWSDGSATPLPPVAVADTVTDLSGASTALSTALILTVRVLVVSPAAIVKVSFVLSVKSSATAGETSVADTTSVTFSLDTPLSVAVTVVESPFSEIESALKTRVTVGVASSSVIVRVLSAGFATPRPPDAVADTVTDLSGASTALFTALILTVPVLVVAPAAIVSVSFVLSVKSEATAGDTAVADTVTVTSALDGPLSVAVTVVESPFSPIESALNTSDTVGVASSSVIVRVRLDGADTPLPPEAVADTVTDLSGASTALFTALILTVPVLVVVPAAIVSVSFALSAKSEATAGDTAVADTTSVTFSLDGPLSVAVAVVESPFSEIEVGLNTRITVGVVSSFAIVNVLLAGADTPRPPNTVADTVTTGSGACTALFTADTVTVPVLAVSPAAMISVLLPLRVKSAATAGDTAIADTVSLTASLDTPLNVAVTVADPPFSGIESALNTSVTVGVASSSVIVRVWSDGADTPPLVAVADTVTSLSGASTALSTALIVTVPVLVVAPAVIVNSLFTLSVKSAATAGDTAAADTVTLTAVCHTPLSVAVTEIESPPSEIESALKTSVTLGGPSLSVIVTVAPVTASPAVVPVTEAVSSPSASLSSVGVSVNVALPLVESAGIWIVKSGTGA